MRAEVHELLILHYNGYRYRIEPPRGWYFNGEWIGNNAHEALDYKVKMQEEKQNV